MTILDRVRELWVEHPLAVVAAGIAPIAFAVTLLVLFLVVGSGDPSQTQQQTASQQSLQDGNADGSEQGVGTTQPAVTVIVRGDQPETSQSQSSGDEDQQPASPPDSTSEDGQQVNQGQAQAGDQQGAEQTAPRRIAGFEVVALNHLLEDGLDESALKYGSDGSEGPILPIGNGIVRSSGPRHDTQWELIIPSAGLRSSIVSLGYTPGGAMGSPDNPYVVGWLDTTAAPGQAGNALLAGHRDYEDVDGDIGTGVCWELNNTQVGDFMLVWDDDLSVYYVYTVIEALTLDPTDPDSARYLHNTEEPVITLITCTGSFNTETHRYSHRLVVVGELAAVAAPDA